MRNGTGGGGSVSYRAAGQGPQWGSQVEMPSWGVGLFLGLVVRGGVFGRSLRANVSKVGCCIRPASVGVQPHTGRAGLGQEGLLLSTEVQLLSLA